MTSPTIIDGEPFVTRALLLFTWEIVRELMAAARAAARRAPAGPPRRRVSVNARCVVRRCPRPDRLRRARRHDARAARDPRHLFVYDAVAYHSGLERADAMEALRKLDEQFARIAKARRYAPRPYKVIVLSDYVQTQRATFKQRSGYSLDELVERSLASGQC